MGVPPGRGVCNDADMPGRPRRPIAPGSSSSDRDMSGSHWRCEALPSATTSSATTPTRCGSRSSMLASRSSGTSTARVSRRQWRQAGSAIHGEPVVRRVRRGHRHGPTPLTEGRPDLSFIESASAHLGPVYPPRCRRGVGIDDVPGHDGGIHGAHARGGVRADRRRGLLCGLQPGAHRPRQPGLDPYEYAQGGLGKKQPPSNGSTASTGPWLTALSRCREPTRPSSRS